MNFRIHEKGAWVKAAGGSASKIYEYYTFKNEMMKRTRKTPMKNYFVPMSNIGMLEMHCGMHRETKAKAIRKLKMAGLIDYQREIGGAYQICKLI
tara:strand:- start:861 stop:1145 length:285 start_codon:yes stop_codon:yes gene_type:complete